MNRDGQVPPEIIIIRRSNNNGEEAHHGGVWKIAYADFMTAMMALFLVMWLVNATDEKTLNQVVTYFNPVELTDRTTTDRGVQDLQQGGTGKDAEKQPPKNQQFEKHAAPKDRTGRQNFSDEGLFSDPYDVLAKLAAKASKVPLPTSDGIRQDSDARMAGGDAFRDPFDPDFRFNSNAPDSKSSDIRPRPVAAKDSSPSQEPGAGTGPEAERGAGKAGAMPFTDHLAKEAEAAAEAKRRAAAAEKAKEQKDNAKTPDAKAAVQDQAEKKEAAAVRTELRQLVAKSHLAELPQISVKQTAEGVLISLTDKSNFEMFGLSSAEPKPELVVLMEQIAKVLTDQTGDIIIRGYTDARPFRSKTYDNWRLSTARAHIAHYMLLRGGLPKERVARIEGYADRDLKVPSDPTAPQNRRIEILLRPAKA